MANELLDAVNWAWRKFANPTLPSPGTKHEPAKEDIFAFGELLQSEVDAAKSLAVSGAVGFETEAAMNGDLDHDAGTIALVDGGDAFRKVGASGEGSWAAFTHPAVTAAEDAATARDEAEGFKDEAETAAAAALAATIGALPASITHAWRWRKRPADAIISDLIGTSHIDLDDATSWTGYSVDADGWIVLEDEGGLLPDVSHRWITHMFLTEEGGVSGPYFGTGRTGGTTISRNYGTSKSTAFTNVYGLHGPGVHEIYRDDSTSGAGVYELECGAPVAVAAVDSSATSGANNRAHIGTGVSTPVSLAADGKVARMTNYYTLVSSSAPTADDLEQVRAWLRAQCLADGLPPLTADDCRTQAVLVIASGDQADAVQEPATVTASFAGNVMTVTVAASVAKTPLAAGQEIAGSGIPAGVAIVEQSSGTTGGTGDYVLSASVGTLSARTVNTSGAPTYDIMADTPEILIASHDFASRAAPGRRMARMSLRAGFRNNGPDLATPAIGWETGYRSYFTEAPTDGRPHHLLRLPASNTFIVEPATYTSTFGGSWGVTASDSRNPDVVADNGAGLIHQLFNRNFWKAEAQARLRGIGYTSIVFYESAGDRDTFVLGEEAFPDSATMEGIALAKRDYVVTYFGIGNPVMVWAKPAAPTLGTHPLFPNDATGAERLAAAGYAGSGMDRAGLYSYTLQIDDNAAYDIYGLGLSPAGSIAKGRRAGALVRSRLSTRVRPALASDPALASALTLNGWDNTAFKAKVAAVQGGSSRGRIVILGDSTYAVGFGAGTGTGAGWANGARQHRVANVMAGLLTAAGVPTLDGGMVVNNGMGATQSDLRLYDPRISHANGAWPVTLDQAYAGGGIMASGTSALTFQEVADVDTFEIVVANIAGVTWTIAIDGAAPASFKVDGVAQAGGTVSHTPAGGVGFVKLTVAAASAGQRLLSVTASGTSGSLRSISAYNSAQEAFDILVHGASSATALDHAAAGDGVKHLDSLEYDTPDLTISATGINDMDGSLSSPGTYNLTSYQDSVQDTIDKAVLTGSYLLVFPYAFGNAVAPTWRDAAAEVATDNSIPFLDLYAYYEATRPQTVDGVHGTAVTYAEMAKVSATALLLMAEIPD